MSEKTSPRILVFIPAYRCEKQIGRVLDQIDELVCRHVDTVLVIDNRSPDNTLEMAIEGMKRNASACDFIAWKNDDNYGLGGSHKAAFRFAIENNFDYVIVLHGDDQADIHDILPILDSRKHELNDCMLGARFMPGSQLKGYSRFRTFGNKVYNALFSSVTLRKVSDLGSGLNIYKLSTFREFYYKTFPDDLTFNYVMLLASVNKKQKIAFFPISWREEDQSSNVRLFRQAAKVLGLLSRYFFGKASFIREELRGKPFDKYTGTIVFKKHN